MHQDEAFASSHMGNKTLLETTITSTTQELGAFPIFLQQQQLRTSSQQQELGTRGLRQSEGVQSLQL